MKRKIIAAAAALATWSAASAAQAGIHAEANAASVTEVGGVELGVGYRFAAGKVRVTPIVGLFVTTGEDDGRYREETFSNGNTVCRDTSNGQFADDVNCAANYDTAAYGKLEAAWRFTDSFELGAGARLTEDEAKPYAVLGFGSTWGVKAAVGDDYYALGVAFGF
ncbi:MAG TPA: hypothetical protein VD906_11755 [Caulobacteraceae bacterium]|nr:hypothetical protein [Caulobacteraceae bacterium]